MAAGIGTWCGIAKGYYGATNVTTLGDTYSQMGGAGVAAFVSGVICFAGMWIAPEDYDFNLMRRKDAFQIAGTDAYGHHTAETSDVSPHSLGKDLEYDEERKDAVNSGVIAADDDPYVHNDCDDSVVSAHKPFLRGSLRSDKHLIFPLDSLHENSDGVSLRPLVPRLGCVSLCEPCFDLAVATSDCCQL